MRAKEKLAQVVVHAAGPRYEARRRVAVRAVFAIFFLSLVEGPLRKWFLPSLSGPLTVLRDPLVILLYGYCLRYGLMLRRGIAGIWLSFAIITSAFGLVQYAVNGHGLLGWMLGVRTYWLYMPMAFVIAKCFSLDDLSRFLRLCALISIPYAFLVAAQYSSPPGSFINLGVGADEEGGVGLGDGILRPFGLFTYTGPNVQFTAFTISAFLGFYLSGAPMKLRLFFLVATGAAVGTMAVLTGSRLIYFHASTILIVTVLGLAVVRPTRKNLGHVGGMIGFVLLAGLLLIYAFPDMRSAMEGRIDRAAAFEGSIWSRALGELFSFIDPMFTAPTFGAGIGAGAPGVAALLGLPALIYGESDLQRNVNELGLLLGIAMLALRFGTAALLLAMAKRAAKAGIVLALPFAGFAALSIFMEQITHSTLNGYLVWLAIGLLIAASRTGRRATSRDG